MLRPVYTINAPTRFRRILNTPAQRVGRIDRYTRHLVEELFETLANVGGVGLAAPQVGVPQCVFVVAFGDLKFAVVNPQLRKVSRQVVPFDEGCLSLPGSVTVSVMRPAAILMTGWNELGVAKRWRIEGPLARIFQHEYDHLQGRLISAHVRDIRQVQATG